jgi:outer membrane protein OmpA-like peptidoglycan-associated protein
MRSVAPYALGLATLGCVSAMTPNELIEARSAYGEARVSRAANFSQERLTHAKQALDQAEGAYEAAPGTPEARALAYVALRRAELAKVSGDYEFHRHVVAELQERRRTPAETATPSAPEPTSPSDDAAHAEQDLAQRDAAENAVLVEALSELAPRVTVTDGTAAMIITLDASLAFVPKKADIAPGANDDLEKVAHALARLDPERAIVVKGHTDSTGPDAQSLALSKGRAEALKSYLVSRGIVAERITAEGRGKQEPVSSNDSAEGRALNRRIEIIVARKQGP